MPTYTYRCKACDHEFDARQRFADTPLTECPNCGGTLRRVVGNVGVVFKGSGFYVTDNRGSQGKSKTKSKTEKTSKSANNGKSESKPSEKKKTPKAKESNK